MHPLALGDRRKMNFCKVKVSMYPGTVALPNPIVKDTVLSHLAFSRILYRPQGTLYNLDILIHRRTVYQVFVDLLLKVMTFRFIPDFTIISQ